MYRLPGELRMLFSNLLIDFIHQINDADIIVNNDVVNGQKEIVRFFYGV